MTLLEQFLREHGLVTAEIEITDAEVTIHTGEEMLKVGADEHQFRQLMQGRKLKLIQQTTRVSGTMTGLTIDEL